MLFKTEFNYNIFDKLGIENSFEDIKNTIYKKKPEFYNSNIKNFFTAPNDSKNLIKQIIEFENENLNNLSNNYLIKDLISDINEDVNSINKLIYCGNIFSMIEDNFISLFNHLKTYNIDYTVHLKEIKECIDNIVVVSKEINDFSVKSKDLIKELTLLKEMGGQNRENNVSLISSSILPNLSYKFNNVEKFFGNENLNNLFNNTNDNVLINSIEKLIKIRNNCIYSYLDIKPSQAYLFSFKELNPIQKIIIKRNTLFREELTTQQKIDAFYKFEDGSVAFKINGKKIPVLTKEEYEENYKKFIEYKLKDRLRKNPNYFKPFCNFLQEGYYNDNGENTFLVLEKFLNNNKLIKSGLTNEEYQNFVKYLSVDMALESFDDKLSEIIKNCTAKQNLKNITSSKSRHILNEDTFKTYEKLMNLDIPLNIINETISKKINAFQSSETFNDYLISVLNNLSGFNKDNILNIANELNTNILINSNDYLILKIDNYNESVKLGSANWCIKREEYYFDRYVNDDTFQYFVFDFNKSIEDKNSLIGITLYRNGNFYTSHDREDNSINKIKIDNIIENIIKKENIKRQIKNKIGVK